nr:efflux RND transporter permease subunit [Saprospiraceae bacterium]
MRAFLNYFIKFPVAANLIMFGILIMGVVGMMNMKSTFFPEVESRIIQIQIVYPGASPEEIEEGIVKKIEENLKGVTGVERYTSVSRENSGTVTVEVLKGYKPDLVLQDVKNAVDQISSFPVGMEPPTVFRQENLGFAISYAISGDVDLKTLKRYSRQVEDDLLAIDGISKVSLSGFPEEEIEIAFRERDLRAYGLTFQQATQAVRNANIELTGGTIKGKDEELLVRARNKAYYAEGLRDIVVKTTPEGSVVRLHQIANITDQWADTPSRSFLNGHPSVVVTVQNTLEEDVISVTDKVKAYMEGFNKNNQAVQAIMIRDGTVILRQRIALLTENGILGFVIVVLLLAMFLHWRLAFWVAISIPISFAGMFILANALGITLNVISLFGMILVIGILVDDGIVIGENIYQNYERGEPRLKAALDGTLQVLPAVFAAIITTVLAFSSFLFIDGRLGDFFSEMAIVVIFSLTFSLIEGG